MAVDVQDTATEIALRNSIVLRTLFGCILAERETDIWHNGPDCRAGRSSRYTRARCQHPKNCYYRYGSLGILARCARVNKTWHYEAVPLLWTNLFDIHDYLHDIAVPFEGVDLSKRQFYANFVQEANLIPVMPFGDTEAEHEQRAVLLGLDFPRLKRMYIKTGDHGALSHGDFPQVECVTFYNIDQYWRDASLDEGGFLGLMATLADQDFRQLLKQTVLRFPKLSQVQFIQPTEEQPWYDDIVRDAITDSGHAYVL